MKILVIRFSSIGDIVLTTPVLRCLKQQVKGVEVHFLTKAAFRAIVAHNPNIDKCFYLEKQDNWDVLIKELKAEKYDHIIDLHKNLRSLRIKQNLKRPSTAFRKLNFKKWLLVNFKVNTLPDTSIVNRYLDTLKQFGVKNDGAGLDCFIPETAEVNNKDIPLSHWAGYIACVIGGSYATKKYPVEKWREFCLLSPLPIILLGGPDDREEGNLIAEIDHVKVYNACGKFNINESACLVKYAKAVITNDTGLMHIAAAFQKPIISLWGNTIPEMGMFPYFGNNNINDTINVKSIMLEVKGLRCRPCSKIGYSKCPKGHFKCMNSIEPSIIAEKLNNF